MHIVIIVLRVAEVHKSRHNHVGKKHLVTGAFFYLIIQSLYHYIPHYQKYSTIFILFIDFHTQPQNLEPGH